jgi:hypothetical protein
LLQEALSIWRSQLVPTVVLSQLHSRVLAQLTAMQLQPTCEAVTPDGLFSVDIVVAYKGVRVAIEVLGPDHYTANTVAVSPLAGSSGLPPPPPQHMLLGSELLRFRLLSARGFALAAVSAFEMAGAGATAAGTQALRKLLKQKLEEAVAVQQQYMAAQGAASPGPASADGAPSMQQQDRRQQQVPQQQRQRRAGSSSIIDPQLSRLATQAGYTEQQQRVRRSKAKYLEQRQQQHERRGLPIQQEAMQTLMSAAGQAPAGAAAAASGAAGDEFADASDGFANESASGLDSFEQRLELYEQTAPDSEFDLPLDLEGLDLFEFF